ncbi:MAG: SbcC/MukB-like Walker B domain-containing protein [Anaerolineae bacterium]
MIPEKLHLKNFLSHCDTHLDLRGVHLASLVGENGAGKSSLLDAITWAAWGRSRASYGHDEDLIYHGERWLEVEFVFRIPYRSGEEQRFRILRRRELKGRRSTTSVLDFQVFGEDGWHSINGNTMRETQARIEEHLGLDYETFINSAYLRQGNADEFTVQSPAQRKRVLGAILSLDRWDVYRERVKTRLSRVEGEKEALERRLDEIDAELARRPTYEEELAQAQAEAQTAGRALQEIQEQVNELTRIREQALGIRRQIEELEQRITQEQARLHELQEERETHVARLETYQARIASADEIEARYRRYHQMLEEEQAWSEKLSQAARLQEEKARQEQRIARAGDELRDQLRADEQKVAQLERTVAEARSRIEQQLGDLRGQLRTLKERRLQPELAEELETATARLSALQEDAEALEEARTALQEIDVERSRLRERNRQLRALMDETKERLDVLAEAEAVCPLCRQPLSPEHQTQMLEQIHAEGQAMGDEYRANRDRLQALDEQETTLKAEIRRCEQALRERTHLEQRVARLRQQQEQAVEASERSRALREEIAALETRLKAKTYAEEAQAKLIEVRERLAERQRRLEAGAYAEEARAALKAVLQKLKAVGYDAEAHEDVKARARDLAEAEAAYRELEKARVGVASEEETLARLTREIAKQEKRKAELEARRAARQAELEALKPRLDAAPRLLEALKAARQREVEVRQRVIEARQALAALDTQEERRERYVKEREELAEQVALLTELREACGVNGIPAMIIEHTLPELETEANRILEQLTGGRMHVRFETQRETKSGTVQETLDIIISDEKGTRPYESFSGGEKFRINFAIRVALSQLLAQRAGVRLRSLFIDEGFGSLDPDGRRRLVEAVKAVQADFDVVLVITHIEELQDAFPTRIQVTKTEAGSQVMMV